MSETPAKTALWVKVLLITSLALNFVIIGVIGGAMLSPDGPRSQMLDAVARDIGASPFVRAIDPQDRRQIARAYREKADPLRRNRDDMREGFVALLQALRDESFEPDQVADLLASQRMAAAARQEIGEQVLVEYLSGLSLQERRAFAERLQQVVRSARPPREADRG